MKPITKFTYRAFQTAFNLARYAHKEANPLYPVPVLMDTKGLKRFYYDVMEESE